MCPQLELQPVSIVDAPLDVSLTSRWPLLARLCLRGTDGDTSTAEAVLNSRGADVTVGDTVFSSADTHRQLQGLLDGFIQPRWVRAKLVAACNQPVPPVRSTLSVSSPALPPPLLL